MGSQYTQHVVNVPSTGVLLSTHQFPVKVKSIFSKLNAVVLNYCMLNEMQFVGEIKFLTISLYRCNRVVCI